jgi:hypothetical protein
MTKNQPTAGSSSSSGGQLDITGSIQNIRPASAATGITSDPITTTGAAATTTSNINDIIDTVSMIVVEATFFDKANNIVEVKNIAAEPNSLGPGQSGIFHIIVKDPSASSIAKATYLAQWVGVDSAGNQVLLHPTAEELQAGATPTIATTATPTPDAIDTTTTSTSPSVSQ